MIEELIDRFAAQAPAALMFRSLFARVFSDERLDSIFASHRQRQVESEVLFSTLVRLLVPVVSGGKPSVHASYQASDLEVSGQAVYDKLKGIEVGVTSALLRVPIDELCNIQNKAKVDREDIIPGYHTYIIDGKKFDGTQHRLKETRKLNSAPLPGMAVAVLDTRHELFIDLECENDPYRCERKVFEPIANRLVEGALYIADRNFCDGPVLSSFVNAKAFFLVRHHARSPSWRELPGVEREAKGRCSSGRVYEQEIEVRLADQTWFRVRRVTVEMKKATRKGDKTLHLLTNLPPSVSAEAIADGYAKRWTIETCLGYLAQALNAEINTLCYPAAAGLCFSLALTLFNIMSTIKALMLRHAKPNKKAGQTIDLSYYYLAHEIAECQAGLRISFDDQHWKTYAAPTCTQFTRFLVQIAKQADLSRYRKHPRGPKKPPPKRKSGKNNIHVSTQRVLNART